jgi:ribosomal protein L12E/L44/L45/RPP1/RPP2
MAKRIEEIFEECLKCIEHGESIESCLARYPEKSQELELMLRTFVNVKWRTTLVEPSPQSKLRGRAKLLNIYRQRAYEEAHKAKQPGGFRLQRILVPALAGIVIFILVGGVGTAAASSNAMPDQPLYPVKLATEEVRLALSFSDVDKAVVNTEIAQERAQEIAAMAEIGKTEYIAPATERMLNNLENAEQAINKVIYSQPEPPPAQPPEGPPEQPAVAVTANITDNQTAQEDINGDTGDIVVEDTQTQRMRESYEKTVENNLAVLEATLDKVPESEKSTIQNALNITRTKKEKIESTSRIWWQDRNKNGIPDKDEVKSPWPWDNRTPSTEEDMNNIPAEDISSTDNTTGTQKDSGAGNTPNSDNITAITDNVTVTSDNATTTKKINRVEGTGTSNSANITTTAATGATANTTASSSNTTDTSKDSSKNNWKPNNRPRIFWPWRFFR